MLHCVYYEPDETDLVPVAGRYADSDTTVRYLKELANCVRGRFHWVKGNGKFLEKLVQNYSKAFKVSVHDFSMSLPPSKRS